MHELYLAESLMDEIEKVFAGRGASRVSKVTVAIGRLSGVGKEPFEFAFRLISEGRITEHAELLFEEIPLELFCGDCGAKTRSEVPSVKCGHCNSGNVRMTAGREFLIKSMEIE